MADNRCLGFGVLVGAKGVVATDAHAYATPADPGLGCSHLVCSACGGRVRHDAGWAWSGAVRPELAKVLEAELSDALRAAGGSAADGALEASETGRLYRCRCSAHVEQGVSPIARYRESGTSAVGEIWSCAGHPVRSLPATIEGVVVDPASANARAWVLAAIAGAEASAEAASAARMRLGRLYFALIGTDVEADMVMAIAALLTDPEQHRRDLAVAFYALAPGTIGAERIGIWIAERPDLFAPSADRPDRLRHALVTTRRAIEAGRPYEPPIQELFRREALSTEHAASLYQFMAYHDRDWFIDHAHEMPVSLHDDIRALLPYTVPRAQRGAVEARLDAIVRA